MSPLKTYTSDIDTYFGQYKDHPAIILAKKLASERDAGFDAVMGLAIRLSPPPALKPLVAFTDDVPAARFGKDNAILFGGLFVLTPQNSNALIEHRRNFLRRPANSRAKCTVFGHLQTHRGSVKRKSRQRLCAPLRHVSF